MIDQLRKKEAFENARTESGAPEQSSVRSARKQSFRRPGASSEDFSKRKDEEMQNKNAMNTEQQDIQKQLEEQFKAQQQVELLEGIAKQFLSKDAIERYGRVKVAHPSLAIKVVVLIAQAAQTGQLSEQISDAQLKELLARLQEGKKEFRFKK